MLEKYIDFINTNFSKIKSEKLLLAVSGGVDSMVMLDLSVNAKLDIAVAHINHKMRDKSSDLDAELVSQKCNNYGVPFHLYEFDENEKSSKNFQEKARKIRYEWMSKLCAQYDYSYIFTAHHSNDRIETFFINLVRGAGLNGLSSIPVLNNNIFRPLINFSKDDILDYALSNNIEYREDESNISNKYRRNLIRNEWMPCLNKSGLPIDKMISKSINNLNRDKFLLDHLVKSAISQIEEVNLHGYKTLNLNDYISDNQDYTASLLFSYLKQYGFSFDNVRKSLKASVGSIFQSDTHELLKDRNKLIIREKGAFESIDAVIESLGSYSFSDFELTISSEKHEDSIMITNLNFPFTIRNPRSGDRFKPLGMNGASKKVKDYLTDLKLDLWTKKSTVIIEKKEEIVALLPYRIAHGYRNVDSDTKLYLRLQYS